MQQPKNKNILLLSTIYPVPEGNKGTKVCHYFAKEWMAMGYNVRVVNIVAVYPRILHWVARLATSMIEAKTGAVVYTKRAEIMHYEMDGVPVFLYPLFKMMPHGKFTQCAIRKMIAEIVMDNAENGFKPDYILGHFLNPALEVVSRLKDIYPEAKTTIVVHGDINQVESIYGGGRFSEFSKNIDCWGFRSRPVQAEFEEAAGKVKNPYICYSGIPESMLLSECNRSFEGELRNFNYTGLMIARKHPKAVAEALKKAYGDKPFCLRYVGQGGEQGNVKTYVEENGMSDKVVLAGRVPREQVTRYMDEADCFVMISQGEAFGLVYLEAMARGCITIASRGEGVDGIIIDGENGFLCKAGDSDELADIFKRINALTPEQRKTISENGRKTVAVLTDKNVAKMYIEDVTNLSKINIQQQTTMYQGFTPPCSSNFINR